MQIKTKKLRARDTRANQWTEAITYMLHTHGQLLVTPSDVELTESTGLLDKNGVEIFEGDIITHDHVHIWPDVMEVTVEILSKSPLKPLFVEWNNALVGFEPFCSDEDGSTSVSKHLTVVGNIYDTPELLKNQGEEN